MKLLFQKKTYTFLIIIILIIAGFFLADRLIEQRDSNLVKTTVDRGEVNETISVSGYVEAKNTAKLAFPSTGVVTEVYAEEGDEVKAGEVLATLASNKLAADRSEALAALSVATSQLEETLSGPTETQRLVTDTTVNNAKSDLAQTKEEQAEKVENARRALLSNDLEAVAEDPQETATAPTITGTYTCEEEGVYSIDVFSSNAASGYSYRLSGLENKTSPAYTDQPSSLGECGLYIKFAEGGIYNNSTWTIEVPNKRSSTYTTYKNAYNLALRQQSTAIEAAENALQLAEEQADNANAPARTEQVNQRQGAVAQARARIAQIDALIADRSIIAPFDGIVTDVNVNSGETAGTAPLITVLAEDAFELKARIPEIDVRKINRDQKVEVIFDAAQNEKLTGEIKYVSPLATEIDGVAYFEATIELNEKPEWLRSGLNADIEIIIGQSENTLRLPKRFIINEDGKQYVKIGEENKEVEILFTGNDGYVAVSGIEEGQEVIAP